VLEGELVVRNLNGVTLGYKAGDSFVETVGEYLSVGNISSAKTRVAAAALLPKGAVLTTNQDGTSSQNAPPGPTTVYRNQTPAGDLHGDLDLVQLFLEFAPGAWTPSHTHGGRVVVTVLDGEKTVRSTTFGEQKHKAGESFVEGFPDFIIVGNGSSTTPIRNAAIILLPTGAALTTTQAGLNTQGLPPGPSTIYRTQMSVTSTSAPQQNSAAAVTADNVGWWALGGGGLLLLGVVLFIGWRRRAR